MKPVHSVLFCLLASLLSTLTGIAGVETRPITTIDSSASTAGARERLQHIPATASNPAFFHSVLYVSGAACVTAGMIHFDQRVYTVLSGWEQRSGLLRSADPVITSAGDGLLPAGLFGGCLGYGYLFDNDNARRIGALGLESFAASGVAVQVLKSIFGRERPSVASGSGGIWHGPFSYFRQHPAYHRSISSFDSFPSGHSATAFAAATVFADIYHQPWISYVSYSIASGVAISRAMNGTHWASDCFVGGLIGILATRSLETINLSNDGISLGPTTLDRTYGLKLTYQY